MPIFKYDQAILGRYPGMVGGVMLATGVTNGPTPPALVEAYDATQAAVVARIGATPLSGIPALAAWRRAVRGFGVDPTHYRSAAEAPPAPADRQGALLSIGTLVDLATLVSIRRALPVAVFDLRSFDGGLTVRFARGDERWSDLGSSTTDRPAQGEVVFADEADVVMARRWCWRQGAESAARDDSTEVLITVEGHHDGAADDVLLALDELEGPVRAHTAPRRSAGRSSEAPSPRSE